ncbi:hypothetical protein QJS04_geneDACA008537 [Acorus gramineus]|uniref:DUF7148 domain-containing protein n=1 Tax=Acorus gramineus TaxID=55184 RepID=A0AAV9AFR5_ACOGR|nr:hypothetical protein QJS04_geneDACA008537 [Acorus gramineus]
MACSNQILHAMHVHQTTPSQPHLLSSSSSTTLVALHRPPSHQGLSARHRTSSSSTVAKASPGSGGAEESGDDGDGVSLGTMRLPANIDVDRFELLLFQWANSLCQGANLPLPTPLKVDRVKGGARLGFTTVGDDKVDVSVYIDCLVFPATGDSGPMFRAIRNGSQKDDPPLGEPRIMRSLLQALQKSIQIART